MVLVLIEMRTFIVCTISVFCCLVVGCGVGGHYIQSTGSMLPTIGIGDHMGTFEIKNETINPIERFDIVVYKPQSAAGMQIEENARFIHRVIGLPNETIEINKGLIYINGNLVKQPFKVIDGGIDFPATKIPKNEYFLLGDNRPQSLDSRFWNKPTIKREDIYGKVGNIISKEDYDKGKRW